MVEYDGFDDLLAVQANKSGEQEGQIGRQGIDIETLPIFDTKYLYVWNVRIKEQKQEITSGFVVGHPLFGVVGLSEVGPLTSDIVLSGVTSQNNTFPEFFGNMRFINNGSSTGSWNETTRTYTLDDGEKLITEIIAWQSGKVIKNTKLNLTSDNNAYLSATLDIGSNYTHDYSAFNAYESIAANIYTSPATLTIENVGGGSPVEISEYIFTYITQDAR